jgi:small subunit ribosomal protein S17
MDKKRKSRFGRVVSSKMDKTAVVAVETRRHHPIYKKTVRRITRYKVHDEMNECQLGDTVRLEETRPLSKEKRWRVAEIVIKAEQLEVRPAELEAELEETVVEADETLAEPEGTAVEADEMVVQPEGTVVEAEKAAAEPEEKDET